MLASSHPVKTVLTSTRGYAPVKSIDPGPFYRLPLNNNRFDFLTTKEWLGFPGMVYKNLVRISAANQPPRVIDMKKLITEYISPILESNCIHATFKKQEGNSTFIGHADYILYKSDDSYTGPILIGLHDSDLALNTSLVENLQEPKDKGVNKQVNNEVVSGNNSHIRVSSVDIEGPRWAEAHAIESTERLCNMMLVNNVKYGYISNDSSTRFIQILGSNANGYELSISKPISSPENGNALAATCIEAYYSHLRCLEGPCFKLLPETVECPSISPLSSYDEGAVGRVMWWVAKKINRRKYIVQFDVEPQIIRSLGDSDSPCVKTGCITIDNRPSELVTFFISQSSDPRLRQTASMLQFLNTRRVKHVPQIIVFSRMLDFYVLVLKPFGQPVSLVNLRDSTIINGMHEALTDMHNQGVMLGNLDVTQFYIEHRNDNKNIKIGGLADARLFRRVPTVARESEHSKLDAVIRHYNADL